MEPLVALPSSIRGGKHTSLQRYRVYYDRKSFVVTAPEVADWSDKCEVHLSSLETSNWTKRILQAKVILAYGKA